MIDFAEYSHARNAPLASLGPFWIRLNRAAYELLGSPLEVKLLYSVEFNAVGIRPAREGEKFTLRCLAKSSSGSRVIRSVGFIQKYDMHLPQTLRFWPKHLDERGVMILDLPNGVPLDSKVRRKRNAGDPLFTV